MEADSNTGTSHIDYAIEHARKELSDYFAVEPEKYDMDFAASLVPFLRKEAAKRKEWELAKTMRYYIEQGGYYDAADEGIRELFPQHIQLFTLVMGTGSHGDVREWVSRRWGWVALRGNQAEAADITDATISTFVRGVLDILATLGGTYDTTDVYHLNKFSGGRSLSLTVGQMESGDYAGGDTTGTKEPMGRNAALARLDAQAMPSFYDGKMESLSETTIRQYDHESGGEELAAAAIAQEMATPLNDTRARYQKRLKNGVKLVIDFRQDLKSGRPEIGGKFYDNAGKWGKHNRLKLSPVPGLHVAHIFVWYANKRDLPGITARLAKTIDHELGHFRSPPAPENHDHHRYAKDGTERGSSETYRMSATEVMADANAIRQMLLRDPHLTFEEAATAVLSEMDGLGVARRLLSDPDYKARLHKQVRK